MEAYSQPWTPAMTVRVGPLAEPVTSTKGTDRPASSMVRRSTVGSAGMGDPSVVGTGQQPLRGGGDLEQGQVSLMAPGELQPDRQTGGGHGN
jgi:hypothetical protein